MLIFYIYLFILGTVIGSFLNVCIYRYQTNEPIAKGRSHCPKCNHQLAWYDLIPVFSWLSLKGKCRYCHEPIAARYPIVELLTAILYVLVFWKFEFTFDTLIYLVIVSTLVYAAFVDHDSMIIPDRTHIILIICGALLMFLHPETITERLIGLVIISVPLFIVAYVTKGLGYGDVKLMAAIGLVIGFKNNILAFLIGVILGAIVGIYKLRFKNSNKKDEMPLGPHLIIGILISIFIGTNLINWYISLF